MPEFSHKYSSVTLIYLNVQFNRRDKQGGTNGAIGVKKFAQQHNVQDLMDNVFVT